MLGIELEGFNDAEVLFDVATNGKVVNVSNAKGARGINDERSFYAKGVSIQSR